MKKLNFKQIEIFGVVFGILVGGLLHFTYELSGYSEFVALFSAVNESVWEHTKLFFFPVLFYLVVEWFYVQDKKTLLLAKVLESLFGIGFIIGIFYLYTLIIPDNFLVDIAIFVLAVALGKQISYQIVTAKREWRGFAWLHATVLALITILYFMLTFIPTDPTYNVPLLKDEGAGCYGRKAHIDNCDREFVTGLEGMLPESLKSKVTYPIVDTGQEKCFTDKEEIGCSKNSLYYGQDANFDDSSPSYKDNRDGTVTDNITDLMWQKDPGAKVSYAQAVAGAKRLELAGYTDWRLPTIKELYSLIDFSGIDIEAEAKNGNNGKPFLNSEYFNFKYGDLTSGDRIIDSQWATSTKYVSTVMNGQECFFGVNFADGRIKCYPTQNKDYYVIYVRGNTDYGVNDFELSSANIIEDKATGLMWQKGDSRQGYDWLEAIDYCQQLDLGGYTDWRLPNAKELQSIVDYARSPSTTASAAIAAIFDISSITNEAGQADYPFFWSSTTHQSTMAGGSAGAYVSFGRAMGQMRGTWMDVHGAGAQRSDPKTGDASRYSEGRGPQGDAVRIQNYARCVRN